MDYTNNIIINGSGAKKCTKYLRETFMCWGFNRRYELHILI